jgi:23S rRNA pseudouridine2605 synthase
VTAIRLARYLARAGAASRRGAADLVRAGRVRVNGRAPLGPGDPVDPEHDRVTVDGRAVRPPAATHLAFNKPAGTVTSRRGTARHPSVFDLVGGPPGLVAVGRLDAMTDGLLLFTTDGDLAARLMHPRFGVERSYTVRVAGRFGADARAALERGVDVGEGPPLRPMRWRFTPDRAGGVLELALAEGRNRIVRRACAALGLGVRRLTRTAYGPVRLGALARGASRPLTPREVVALYTAAGLTPGMTPA